MWKIYMPLLLIIILGLVQGTTEFLPISSSAHLILVPYLLEIDNQGLVIDICLHIGTLLAVVIYFRKELIDYIQAIPSLFRLNTTAAAQDLKKLILATLPIIFVGGLVFLFGISNVLRNLSIIGIATIFFGLLLYFADIKKGDCNSISNSSFRNIFIIGCSQILAIIPGTSRAGIVYTSSRFFNISRIEAAKFSMLLSIPTIIISSFVPLIQLIKEPNIEITFYALLSIIIAFVTAIISINFLLKWVANHTMLPFVIYRLILGTIILIVAL